ncbi:hypothetical protein [Pseudoprimorskyibacter insulae]|uniref:Uncharacterized protein n=1 Tax=Pseudoprimorskyibacter insulae TaxID=1695997 RepID=A0A2R8AR52_9RHOB|nr:hypothetical protein [Pseudoprimorskyibacter insulae]SPF78319.1 hypothetical protein PRI8871_00915 [Pseudoprimorskyibacter insulae]
MTAFSKQFDIFLHHATVALFNGALPSLIIAGCIWIVLRLMFRTKSMAATGFLFALVGSLIGVLLGSSREPAVQAIVPALVTLITGYLGWTLRQEAHEDGNGWSRMLAQTDEREDMPKLVTKLVYVAVAALMLSTATASMWGASMRLTKEQSDREYEKWKITYETKQLPIETEILRRKAKLPPFDE